MRIYFNKTRILSLIVIRRLIQTWVMRPFVLMWIMAWILDQRVFEHLTSSLVFAFVSTGIELNFKCDVG